MVETTQKRVVAEAALAKRLETEINERASTADIPALIERVKRHALAGSGLPEGALDDINAQLQGVAMISAGEEEPTPVKIGLDGDITVADLLADVYSSLVSLIPFVENPPIALDEDGVPYITIGD